jgi:hypothetical protein
VGLIASTIFEPDLLCSSRADGSIDAIAVNSGTWDAVAAGLDRVVSGD